MREKEFSALQATEDAAEQVAEKVFDSDMAAEIKKKMVEALKALPESYSIDLNLDLTVFDGDRDAAIRLVHQGITASHGGESYRAYGDSARQRYWVKGEICELPHNYCPNCWAEWDFKFKHKQCAKCGYKLGNDVKELLDDNKCPHCKEGEISRKQLACSRCDNTVGENEIWWG